MSKEERTWSVGLVQDETGHVRVRVNIETAWMNIDSAYARLMASMLMQTTDHLDEWGPVPSTEDRDVA